MKSKRILHAIGDVSDKYVEESAPENAEVKIKSKNTGGIWKYSMATAAVAVVICLCVFGGNLFNNRNRENSFTLVQHAIIDILPEIQHIDLEIMGKNIKEITFESDKANVCFIVFEKDGNPISRSRFWDEGGVYVFDYKANEGNTVALAYVAEKDTIPESVTITATALFEDGATKTQELTVDFALGTYPSIENDTPLGEKKEVVEKAIDNEDVAQIDIDKKIPNVMDNYGGIYNENGKTVVLVVDLAHTNTTELCKQLGINKSTTIFKEVKYSFKYLTDLQTKIGEKMADKTFSFVILSALMDAENLIKITVLPNVSSEQIAEVKRLDTIGGAINIEYSSDEIVLE